jgi:hypothetical protein
MGKHDDSSHKSKKKLTKKELKAINHAKLMNSKHHGAPPGQSTDNVVSLDQYRNDNKKKAA